MTLFELAEQEKGWEKIFVYSEEKIPLLEFSDFLVLMRYPIHHGLSVSKYEKIYSPNHKLYSLAVFVSQKDFLQRIETFINSCL